MPNKPKISVVIPIHNMKNGQFFLDRALSSIREQSFQDWEIVITHNGKMAENTNSAMRKAEGELVKVLYMDDYLAHKDALKNIVEAMDNNKTKAWLITGADTNPHPYWTDDITKGNNHLGSPSALTIRKSKLLYFDERMSWLLDCDLYHRLNRAYGPPLILNEVGIKIGVGDHQMTNILTNEEKLLEHSLINQKYE